MARPVVVVGVGGWANDSHALHAAAELATAFSGELVVVHVRHLPVMLAPESVMAASAAAVIEDGESERAHANSADALSRYGVPWRFEARSGDVAAELLQVAEENAASCVVIGRHGRHHLVHHLGGSAIHHLVDHAHQPVLVVPTLR